jgi:hypothetical protein
MKFDELDKKMRIYETAHDLCVLPGIYMVARRNALNSHCYWILRKNNTRGNPR